MAEYLDLPDYEDEWVGYRPRLSGFARLGAVLIVIIVLSGIVALFIP